MNQGVVENKKRKRGEMKITSLWLCVVGIDAPHILRGRNFQFLSCVLSPAREPFST